MKRPCPYKAKILYTTGSGKAGTPSGYTLDGKTCHAVFNEKHGEKLTVYLLVPTNTRFITIEKP